MSGPILMEHNLKTYKDICEKLKTDNRVLVVQPTGSGKSYLAYQLIDDLTDGKCLVMGPSLWSLENLARKKYWRAEKAKIITFSKLLYNRNIEECLNEIGLKPDEIKLIIIDEAHRALAKKWRLVIEAVLNCCSGSKIVGLTAFDYRKDMQMDVAKEMFNGNKVCNLTLKEAIRKDILPKLTYILGMMHVRHDIQKIEELTKDIGVYPKLKPMIEMVKESWNFDEYFVNLLKKHLTEREENLKHIIFVSSISEADRIKERAQGWFEQIYPKSKINVTVVHSKIRAEQLSSDLEKFTVIKENCNDVDVAICVNMMSESFHIENLESIIIMYGTRSDIAYLQKIGRAMSVCGSKPIIFDFVDNIYTAGSIVKQLGISFERQRIGEVDLREGKRWFETGHTQENISRFLKARKLVLKTSADQIFKEVIDEAYSIEVALEYLSGFCGKFSRASFEKLKRMIEATSCGTVYGIDDECDRNWALQLLSYKGSPELTRSEREQFSEYYPVIALTDFVTNVGGPGWYTLYKLILSGKATTDNIEKFMSYSETMVVRGKLTKACLSALNSKGVHIEVSDDTLDKLIEKYGDKIPDVAMARYKNLTEEYISTHGYAFEKLKKAIESDISRVSTPDMIKKKEYAGIAAFKFKYDRQVERLGRFIKDNNVDLTPPWYVTYANNLVRLRDMSARSPETASAYRMCCDRLIDFLNLTSAELDEIDIAKASRHELEKATKLLISGFMFDIEMNKIIRAYRRVLKGGSLENSLNELDSVERHLDDILEQYNLTQDIINAAIRLKVFSRITKKYIEGESLDEYESALLSALDAQWFGRTDIIDKGEYLDNTGYLYYDYTDISKIKIPFVTEHDIIVSKEGSRWNRPYLVMLDAVFTFGNNTFRVGASAYNSIGGILIRLAESILVDKIYNGDFNYDVSEEKELLRRYGHLKEWICDLAVRDSVRMFKGRKIDKCTLKNLVNRLYDAVYSYIGDDSINIEYKNGLDIHYEVV